MSKDRKPSRSSLQDLPPEILLLIASFLECDKDLLSFSHVCKATYRVLSQETSLWSNIFMQQKRWDETFQLKSCKATSLSLPPGMKSCLQCFHLYDDLAIWIFQQTVENFHIALLDEDGTSTLRTIQYVSFLVPSFVAASKTHAVARFVRSKQLYRSEFYLVAFDLKHFTVAWERQDYRRSLFHVGNNKVYLIDDREILVLSMESGVVLHKVGPHPELAFFRPSLNPFVSYHKVDDHVKWIPFWHKDPDPNAVVFKIFDTDTLQCKLIATAKESEPMPVVILNNYSVLLNLFNIQENTRFTNGDIFIIKLPCCKLVKYTRVNPPKHIFHRLCNTAITINRDSWKQAKWNSDDDTRLVPTYLEARHFLRSSALNHCRGRKFPDTVKHVLCGNLLISAFCDPILHVALRQSYFGKSKIVKLEKYQCCRIDTMKVTGLNLLLLLEDLEHEMFFLNLDFGQPDEEEEKNTEKKWCSVS